jgi:AcrR family transcriptional regulator
VTLVGPPPDAASPPQTRVERKRNRKVQAILRATAEVLADSGYHALSMEKVGDLLDLSKTSLYHYFPSKDTLVEAAIAHVADRSIERLTACTEQALSPGQRLRGLIEEQLRILLVDYPEVTQLFGEHRDGPEAPRAQIRRMRERHDRVFRKVIDEGVAAGEFQPHSADVALHCLHGALNYASVWCRNKRNREQNIAAITDTVMMLFERR